MHVSGLLAQRQRDGGASALRCALHDGSEVWGERRTIAVLTEGESTDRLMATLSPVSQIRSGDVRSDLEPATALEILKKQSGGKKKRGIEDGWGRAGDYQGRYGEEEVERGDSVHAVDANQGR